MRAFALVLLLALAAVPARAQEDDPVRLERWQDLKQAVFGARPVEDGAGVIALDAPARALDAALVPVTVTVAPDGRAGRIAAVWLLVDSNPSPLAGTFRFGPAADPRILKTRIRVDQYTLVHAVAEAEDGRLFSVARFVKAAGGCSAPSSKDAKLAMSRMGQIRVRLDGEALHAGEAATAHVQISHPNNNGMQVDQVTNLFIPARYIQDIKVTYGGTPVLSVDADISLSEDPVITFGFVPRGDGPMRVEVLDSAKATFKQEFRLAGS